MKKLVAFILIFSMQSTLYATAYPNGPCSASVGSIDAGSPTAFVLDSAYVFGTSGDAIGVSFIANESQTTASFTVYVYCTAVTGSPTLSEMYIYASATGANDDDRPDTGSSPIATSSNVDASGCGTAGWLTYSFSSVSLTNGMAYWLVLVNTTGTPASNNFSVLTRGGIDAFATFPAAFLKAFGVYTTIDGFATDPTHSTSNYPPWVIKYSSGTVFGNPYVAVGSALTSNTNWRGMKFTPTEDVKVNGMTFSATASTQQYYRIYNGASAVVDITVDSMTRNNVGGVFFSPITLTGGTSYDIVHNYSSNSAIGSTYTMGTSPPADVQSVNTTFTYVNGATPGSLAETTTTVWLGAVCIYDNPAISGGGTTIGAIAS